MGNRNARLNIYLFQIGQSSLLARMGRFPVTSKLNEHTSSPEDGPKADPPEKGSAPASEAPRMEAMALDELGAGRDMTAGNPEGWTPVQTEKAEPRGEREPGSARPPEAAAAEGSFNEESDRFLVKLDVFEGPLELLLHLVREHELDINDIPIAFITEQYLKYIEMMKNLNVNAASEYLVMASHLVYIKSRTLLPLTEEEEDAGPDPEEMRLELQRQLAEYQKVKHLSQLFRGAEEEQLHIFSRGGNGDGIVLAPDEEPPRLEVTAFDLISAIKLIIEEAGENVHLVEIDELEVADRQAFLLDAIEKAGTEGIAFHSLFPAGTRVLELVVTFLALLELIRQNLLLAYQAARFAEIRIVKAVTDD